ncbi:serine/threonine-protein kinase [Actinoalloteichus sp. GBA129-24]|uniref:serine/threonine-protein kinase n=1 Tax=Actinoalloteichus sp. GBA129-24 TaxID=1612551 RepID=UPI00095079E7|nr:serine/threonine-protein kinase [Actinoalloteichus sp. GBA129-24]APU22555.1 protein kinase family protein [Actinoalloteichus sp. GBA129-24]
MTAESATTIRYIGQYRILGELGRGGMGVVYRGISRAGEDVAVKQISSPTLSDLDRRRFASEIDTLRLVGGPRVVDYLEAGEDEAGHPWLAVRYVPGPTLRAFIETDGPMKAELVAILGASLLDGGLRQIHEASVLHRDLKPHNIILADEGPVLIDFGLALLTEAKLPSTENGQSMDRGRITPSNMVVGTVVCMPSEQVMAQPLTAASDVYALGATLLYAATRHYPYNAPGLYPLMEQISSPSTRPDLSGLAAELIPAIDGMLAKHASDRPSVEEARDLLVSVVADAGLEPKEARLRLRAATSGWQPPSRQAAESAPPTQTSSVRPRVPIEESAVAGSAAVAVQMADLLRREYSRGATF